MLPGPSEELRDLYRLAFVKNCFVLVVRAYGALDIRALKTAEEPHITGELVRSARTLIESDGAEPWMEHMEVLDDPPQTLAGLHGKKRPRIDIEFVRTGRGIRHRFHIEAKRLYRSDSVNEYFGPSGLQMFIHGKYAVTGRRRVCSVMYSLTPPPFGFGEWPPALQPGMWKSALARARHILLPLDGRAWDWTVCKRLIINVRRKIWAEYRSSICFLSSRSPFRSPSMRPPVRKWGPWQISPLRCIPTRANLILE